MIHIILHWLKVITAIIGFVRLERSQINCINDLILKDSNVYVFHEQVYKFPHFHYITKRNHLIVHINTLQIKSCNVIDTDSLHHLKQWLLSTSCDYENLSNYQSIIMAWNANNRSNPVTILPNWKQIIENNL